MLLLREGYDVVGAFLRLGSPAGVEGNAQGGEICEPSASAKNKQGCCSVLDAAVVLSSLYPVITVLLARLILKEHFSRWKAIGIIAGLAAVPMIALQ